MISCTLQFEELIRKGHSFSTADARQMGVTRSMLAYFCKQGKVRRICHGVYEPLDAQTSPYPELDLLVRKRCDFVVCLLSALQIHGFTTQCPTELWIALPRGTALPRLNTPLISCIHLGDKIYNCGVMEKELYGIKFKIFTPAKTVADCFKFRNKIGLDTALEALRDGWRKKLFTIPQLLTEAKVCRIEKIISPYIEGMLA